MLGHKLAQVLNKKFDVRVTIRGKQTSYADFFGFSSKKVYENVRAENFIEVEKTVKNLRPDIIVNAIGIIKQLTDKHNVIDSLAINSIFPHQLAELGKKFDYRLICISTDCVFSGLKGNYTEDDVSDAQDLYGKSKNLGEVVEGNCITIRTSIIGREIQTKRGLTEWFLEQRGKTIKGFTKAIFSGVPSVILADIIADIISNHQNIKGLYHISSEPLSKYKLLLLLKAAYKIPVTIEPFAEFVIDRSLDSTKFRKETGFAPMSWEEMIEKMANDPTPYNKWRR